VLCPIDFSDPSSEALKIAGELASKVGAGLLLVHVVPVLPALPNDPNFVLKVPEYERLLHQDADEKLAHLVREMAKAGIQTRTMVGHGDAASEIVRIAESEKADLIVIATHGTTGWRRFVFGSVAEKVVRFAKCPVLTIRNPQEESA
jgi:nucleotide-binding universal stress UspA family protein